MATIGLQSILFYGFAALMFLIPSTLISAELSGMLSEDNGGIFSWVKAGLGEKAGVVAMWLEWFNNVISFPGSTSTIIASVAVIVYPQILDNRLILWLLMMLLFWSLTFFNFLPLKRIVLLQIFGALFGMITPGILLISGAVYYDIIGASSLDNVSINAFIPAASFATFALLVKTLAAYSGIQSVAFHSKNVHLPQKNIPLSMLTASVTILCLSILTTVSLIVIIPASQVNVLNGLVQAISAVLSLIGFGSAAKLIVAVLIALGMLSALGIWMLGPARGMQVAAEKKLFPSVFRGKNSAGMPVNMLLIQALTGTLLSFSFLLMPSVIAAFALLIALTSQFTVMMWMLVFISAVTLRYTKAKARRPFRVGKQGNGLLILTASVAFLSCLLGFIAGLFPPAFSHIHSLKEYISLIIIADGIIIALPLCWIYHQHKGAALSVSISR